MRNNFLPGSERVDHSLLARVPQELTTRCAHGRPAGVDHSTAPQVDQIETERVEKGPFI